MLNIYEQPLYNIQHLSISKYEDLIPYKSKGAIIFFHNKELTISLVALLILRTFHSKPYKISFPPI